MVVPASLGDHPLLNHIVLLSCLVGFTTGFVNSVFLITVGTFVSSVNGLLSLVARDYFSLNEAIRGTLMLVQIVTFMTGAAFAGFVYDEPLNHSALSYPLGGAGVCVGLFFCVGIFSIGSMAAKQGAVFIAAFSMGFLNAMGTFFSKGVLRTTHQTGAVTDLGVLLGQWLQLKFRKTNLKPPEFWRVRAQVPLLLAFFIGGFCGVAAVSYESFLWMLLPVAVLFCVFVSIVLYMMFLRYKEGQGLIFAVFSLRNKQVRQENDVFYFLNTDPSLLNTTAR
jgi:hypothetical protein